MPFKLDSSADDGSVKPRRAGGEYEAMELDRVCGNALALYVEIVDAIRRNNAVSILILWQFIVLFATKAERCCLLEA